MGRRHPRGGGRTLPGGSGVTTERLPSAASAGPVGGAAPLARLEGVTPSFPGPAMVLALRDVDMVVQRGDYVSIMGPSGSGKSTLLNVLGLLDRPTVGRYELDGLDTAPLRDRDRTRLRGRRLGFVFQTFHLLPRRTVLENVVLGMAYSGVPRGERRARAWEALARVSMTHRAGFFPTTLSGGERQRGDSAGGRGRAGVAFGGRAERELGRRDFGGGVGFAGGFEPVWFGGGGCDPRPGFV
jgi:putative ABC transport system ATP-binding protein